MEDVPRNIFTILHRGEADVVLAPVGGGMSSCGERESQSGAGQGGPKVFKIEVRYTVEQASCLPVHRVFNGLSTCRGMPFGDTSDFAIARGAGVLLLTTVAHAMK